MEWGTLVTTVLAIYIVWYGINFLFDLFIGGKPKIQTDQGVQYNLSDLMGEEEQAQEVSTADFENKTVSISTPAPVAPTSDLPNISGSNPVAASEPANIPAPVLPEENIINSSDDWASSLDQEEVIIDIPVQAQPVIVPDYLLSFKDDAKNKAASVFS